MQPSLSYIDSGAFGTVVERPWIYIPGQRFPGATPFRHPLSFYEQAIMDAEQGIVVWIAYVGCAWDYASCYLDGVYIREPSLGHDIGCHLLGVGAIPKEFNDRVDRVFRDLLEDRSGLPRWRSRALELATHLHNAGHRPQAYLKPKHILNGKHITLPDTQPERLPA